MDKHERQRSYADILVAAQARTLLEGVHESLSLEMGARTPELNRVTVVFDSDDFNGIVSVSSNGSSLSTDATLAMLAEATTMLAMRRLLVTEGEEGDDETP